MDSFWVWTLTGAVIGAVVGALVGAIGYYLKKSQNKEDNNKK